MQLTVQNPDLAQMFGQDSLYNTLYGMQRQDQATANNNQNLGQAQQDQTFQADLHPLEMGLTQANIGHTNAMTALANAQTPGAAADSILKQNTASADSSVPSSIRNNKALNDYLAKTSAADLEAHANRAQADLYSDDPATRENAMRVLTTMPAIQARLMEIRAQGANEAGVANINNQGRLSLENAEAAHGKYDKTSVDYFMRKGFTGNFQQQSGAWIMKAAQLEDMGDTAGAARARELADLARNADHDAKAAAAYTALAGKLNVGAGVGMPQVVNPNNVAPRVPAPTASQSTPQPSNPAPGDIVTVYKPDGTPVKIRAEGLNHLPPGWKKGS